LPVIVISASHFHDTADNQEANSRFATGVNEDHLCQPLAFRFLSCLHRVYQRFPNSLGRGNTIP